jgi:hypothetical protein
MSTNPPVPTRLFYPPISATLVPAIKAVMVHMTTTPGYLDNQECPYSEDLKEIFRNTMAGQNPSDDAGFREFDPSLEVANVFDSSDFSKWELMFDQYQKTYSSLLMLKAKIDAGSKTDKTVTFYKTLIGVLSTLVDIGAKIEEVKEVHDFKKTVLDAVETLMTPEQRQLLIERLHKNKE